MHASWTDLFETHAIDGVIHLAAESHVDRSIESPMDFIHTNIVGTVNLLNACRSAWKDHVRENSSTTFPPMRYTEAWGRRGSSPKRPPTIHAVPTRPQRPVPTTWSGHITIPTGSRW